MKLYLALFGADSSKDFAQHREAVETLLAEDTEHAATDYRELPGDLVLDTVSGEIPVPRNEHFFWKCWVRANFGDEQDMFAQMGIEQVPDAAQSCYENALRIYHAVQRELSDN